MNLPVVFLHAYPLNASMWSAQAGAVGDRTVIAPDFPGFGSRPVGDPSLDHFADVVLAEMDAAGVKRAAVVGLSMGGYVAFRVHAKAPDRLAGLFLADTRAGADDEAGKQKRTDQAERARRDGVAWIADALIPAALGETTRKERPDVVAAVRALIDDADPEGVARALIAMRDRPDSLPQLAAMDFPVVAVVGDEDTLTPPEAARAIADGVPHGKLVTVPGAGHLSNLENPARFNSALASFLTRLDKG